MSVTKQLYRLQELDLKLESARQALQQKASQLGENPEVIKTRAALLSRRQQLEELNHQQRSAEWEIDDLTTKITTLEQKLYAGKITNSKELANLQHEVEGLKTRRSASEDAALEIMSQVEKAESYIANTSNELKKLETEWQYQQQRLTAEIENLKTVLAELEQKYQLVQVEIDPQTVDLYQELKKHKGTAVARVDQGTCRGCQISLSTSELQRVRSGNLVRCNSCGRILFHA